MLVALVMEYHLTVEDTAADMADPLVGAEAAVVVVEAVEDLQVMATILTHPLAAKIRR